jgi:lipoprotein-anchoring transpeptidase ErfK/SrfK
MDLKVMRVAGHRTMIADIATPRIWKVAVLTAAGAIGTPSRSDAALYYYNNSGPGYYYQQDVPPPPRPQRARRAAPKKKDVVVKDTTVHPQMPLVIAVSIQKQQVKIYDANGFFAEAPVSTGMPGHPTPMGVFSVIEKDRYHHSNIYSGAPMPFMQRITWSGVAMHAGVLPGYPASHGCIRMPESFAVKMWGWTKMGARVIVTPGEISMPASFAHPLLPAMKVVPQPPVAETDDPVAPKADKGAPDVKTEDLELRPSVGHGEVTQVALRDQIRTADASGNASEIKSATVTMSDVPKVAAKTETAAPTAADPTNHETVAEAKAETKTEPKSAQVTPAAKPAEAKPQQSASVETKPAATTPAAEDKPKQTEAAARPDGERPEDTEAAPTKPEEKAEKPAETRTEAAKPEEQAAPAKVTQTTTEAKVEQAPAETKVEAKEEAPKAEAKIDAAPKAEVAKTEPVKTESVKTEPVKAEPAKATESKAADAKPADSKVSEKPAASAKEPAKAAAAAEAPASGPKDQTRIVLPGAKPAKRRDGQIAVFISRKDSKLYVRQNFAPLFEVPVTIAPSDRPLGTHVFTAAVDKNDSNLLHWSVVTVPSRSAMREEPRMIRNKKGKLVAPPPVEAKPAPAVNTPAEALDRITIPADTMARILEALTTGGSIIVSDQGINQGETGEGTDFIVSLR